MWFQWPQRADLYLTSQKARLIAEDITDAELLMNGELTTCLSALLKRQTKLNQFTIWLGGGLVRYGVMQQTSGDFSQQELEQLIILELKANESINDSWIIDIAKPDQSGRRLWSAVNDSLLKGIQKAFEKTKVKHSGVAPLLTLFRSGNINYSDQSGFMVILEADSITALQTDASGAASIKQVINDADPVKIRTFVERMQIQTGSATKTIKAIELIEGRKHILMGMGLSDISASIMPKTWQRALT